MTITSASRTIVNYGIYKFTEAELKSKRLRIRTTAIRLPSSYYENFKYQKSESFFGHWQLMSGDYVRSFGKVSFVNQILWEDYNHQLVTTSLAQCVNQNTFTLISALANALSLPTIDLEFFPWNVPGFDYDRIVFKLFSNTTLVVQVESVPLEDMCNFPPDRNDELPVEPGASTEQPVPNPDDSPYDEGTPPYDESTGDNGETYVPEGTEPPDPYPGTGLYNYTLVWRYYDVQTTRTETGQLQGPLSAPYNDTEPASTPGFTKRSIKVRSGTPPVAVNLVLEQPVAASEPDPYQVIVSFSATAV